MIYNLNVLHDRISLDESKSAVSGNVNYYKCAFTFSDEWENLKKVAVFMCKEKTYTAIIEDSLCYIPEEVLKNPSSLSIGVYGTDLSGEDTFRISTDFVHIVIIDGAFKKGTEPKVPSKQLWEIYFKNLEDLSSDCKKEISDFADYAKKELEKINTDAVEKATIISETLNIYPGETLMPGDIIVDFHATAICTTEDNNTPELFNFDKSSLTNKYIDLTLSMIQKDLIFSSLPFVIIGKYFDFISGTITLSKDNSYIKTLEQPAVTYITIERKIPVPQYIQQNFSYVEQALDTLISQQEEIIEIQNTLIGGEEK